ncbi:hypothetical protein ACEWY4_017847 [Coilia grayii]|uniref:Transposase Helix-turn-helix domain-containing protein n=1 Tax=Coilia grayii TaxID=363190 RepID=A0ABD1JI16_9TELE
MNVCVCVWGGVSPTLCTPLSERNTPFSWMVTISPGTTTQGFVGGISQMAKQLGRRDLPGTRERHSSLTTSAIRPNGTRRFLPLWRMKEDERTESGPSQFDITQQTHSSSVLLLELENDMLRKENEKLKQDLEKQKQTFSFSQISPHPDKVSYYTGLPDAATVFFLEALLSKFNLQYHFDWNVQIMPLIDQLLLTLMKLRLNCGVLDLSTRFNCCRATVTNIFITITSALYDILYVGMMENNIPSRLKNQTSLPDCFQQFPNCRIALDCTEVAVSNTERLDTQSHLYSHYKGCTMHKAQGCVSQTTNQLSFKPTWYDAPLN